MQLLCNTVQILNGVFRACGLSLPSSTTTLPPPHIPHMFLALVRHDVLGCRFGSHSGECVCVCVYVYVCLCVCMCVCNQYPKVITELAK